MEEQEQKEKEGKDEKEKDQDKKHGYRRACITPKLSFRNTGKACIQSTASDLPCFTTSGQPQTTA